MLTSILITTLSVVANEPPITDLAFTPEAKHVVAVSQSGIHVYSWPKLDHKRTIPTSALNLHCLAFSPNGSHLAVGGGAPSEEGVVEVFSWPEGEPVTRFDSHKDSVRSVVWQDDVKLLSGSIDRDIKLWHLKKETNAVSTSQRSFSKCRLDLPDWKRPYTRILGSGSVPACMGCGGGVTYSQPESAHKTGKCIEAETDQGWVAHGCLSRPRQNNSILATDDRPDGSLYSSRL